MNRDEVALPIVSICIVSDKLKCPVGFVPITKTYDDGSEADLWKEGFNFFNRVARYLCTSKDIANKENLEVVTDIAIINEKEAVPSNFVCFDYTVDSKEKALKKKYLCARFTPRNDTLDAVTDIIILGKTKKIVKGYTIAGEVDGMVVCYKVSTIPETYGRLNHSQSELDFTHGNPENKNLSINNLNSQSCHSTNDLEKIKDNLNTLSIQKIKNRTIDGVLFQLNPIFSNLKSQKRSSALPSIPQIQPNEFYNYNFNLERSIITQ